VNHEKTNGILFRFRHQPTLGIAIGAFRIKTDELRMQFMTPTERNMKQSLNTPHRIQYRPGSQ
jgi:hypothetical protein